MLTGATFSECRTWRYLLWREWGDGQLGKVVFIGLNPSTADEREDDPTIRRCIGFAKDWGYDGLMMLNLFAFRATDPKVMMAAKDPIGPANDEAILAAIDDAHLVVAAWGQHGDYLSRGFIVKHRLLNVRGVPVKCLGKTSKGAPRHPLYVPAKAPLMDL